MWPSYTSTKAKIIISFLYPFVVFIPLAYSNVRIGEGASSFSNAVVLLLVLIGGRSLLLGVYKFFTWYKSSEGND